MAQSPRGRKILHLQIRCFSTANWDTFYTLEGNNSHFLPAAVDSARQGVDSNANFGPSPDPPFLSWRKAASIRPSSDEET
jgi:hypothetical protein